MALTLAMATYISPTLAAVRTVILESFILLNLYFFVVVKVWPKPRRFAGVPKKNLKDRLEINKRGQIVQIVRWPGILKE